MSTIRIMPTDEDAKRFEQWCRDNPTTSFSELLAERDRLRDALAELYAACPTSCDDRRLNEAQRQAEALLKGEDRVSSVERLRQALEAAVEDIEEMTVLLAEVHLRFGHRVMDEDCQIETDKTFGDFARIYEAEAKKLRLELKGERAKALKRE